MEVDAKIQRARRKILISTQVCFDTGGLDIKPAAAMLTMKKDMGGALCGNQPVRRVRIATPSSRRGVDGVEDDAMIQHERAVKF